VFYLAISFDSNLLSKYTEQWLLVLSNVRTEYWLPKTFFALEDVFKAWVLLLIGHSGVGRIG